MSDDTPPKGGSSIKPTDNRVPMSITIDVSQAIAGLAKLEAALDRVVSKCDALSERLSIHAEVESHEGSEA